MSTINSEEDGGIVLNEQNGKEGERIDERRSEENKSRSTEISAAEVELLLFRFALRNTCRM